MQIREYKQADKKEIVDMVSDILGRLFNGNPAGFEYVKEFRMKKNYIKYLVAETQGQDKKIIATMALRKESDDTVRLKRMYVRKAYRKRGIAQKEEISKLLKILNESYNLNEEYLPEQSIL